jgi:hypothetical protein
MTEWVMIPILDADFVEYLCIREAWGYGVYIWISREQS